jgi:molybdate transport system substrate-binding protein
MDRAVDDGLVNGDPQLFARNELEIIVPPDNPGAVEELADLTNDDLVVAICGPECPAGRYALEVFDNAGLSVAPDSFESDVRGVVTRVALGEADAGIAYVTDTAASSGDVVGVPIPADVGVVAEYPIAALSDAEAAGRWIDFVLSAEGQQVLRRYGFRSP